MFSTADIERQINGVDRDIAILAEQVSKLEHEKASCKAQARRLAVKRNYHRAARFLRTPGAEFDLWPIGVLVCGPAAFFAIFFVSVHALTRSLSVSLVAGAIASVVVFGALWALLFLPRTDTLGSLIAKLDSRLARRHEQTATINRHMVFLIDQLNSLRDDRAKLASSIEYQRELLLRENWRALRGVPWEDFLRRVCLALGYTVETTKTTGDHGVDLVVHCGAMRIAIQAKGYANSVGNSAVQQAVAGMRMYQCQGCAVITNSRFTLAALELAATNDCVMICEENFHEFVRGQIPLAAGRYGHARRGHV